MIKKIISRYSTHSTKLAAVTFLLFCAKEPFQAFQVLHIVLLASRGVQHWRGCPISCSHTGAFCWSNATGVRWGTGWGTVIQHLGKKRTLKYTSYTLQRKFIHQRQSFWTYLSKGHRLGKLSPCAVWGWWAVERGTVPWYTAWGELGTGAGCPQRTEAQHTLALQRRQLGWNWSLLFLWLLGWRGLDTYKGVYNKQDVFTLKKQSTIESFREQKHSPVFLRPRRRCCSGVRAIVEGAIVYLKYFQKSKTAFRLNRVANASSVKQKSKKHSQSHFTKHLFLSKWNLTNIPYRPVGDIVISA